MLFRLIGNGNQATHLTDKADALQDDVLVLLPDNQGTPVIVRVGEPESGSLEETTLFFRSDLYCVQYKAKQDSQTNQPQ